MDKFDMNMNNLKLIVILSIVFVLLSSHAVLSQIGREEWQPPEIIMGEIEDPLFPEKKAGIVQELPV